MTLREILEDMLRDPLGWLEAGVGMLFLAALVCGAFVVLPLVLAVGP